MATPEIVLTKGFIAQLDYEDYLKFGLLNWHSNIKGLNVYATRTERYGPRKDNKKKSIYLHREIVNAKDGEYVDHINQNTLDNRKENLRICTNQQNSANTKGRPSIRISQYKGVRKNSNCNTWCARVTFDGKELYLGSFKTEKEAALKYNEKARELFGDFAFLNEVK